MTKNIAFIGGIHGVGKSTVCDTICNKTGLKYLSASEVLKWKELNDDVTNKKVTDISHNQDRLIIGLRALVDEHSKYLLDGHYCLLNKQGVIEKIPIETFMQINPYSLNLIIDDVLAIKGRLEKRDNKPYDINLLNNMQEAEIFYANEVADTLRISLNICTAGNIEKIISALK